MLYLLFSPELGLNPRKLIKNRPNPSERWKQPVHLWIRELYARREEKQTQKQSRQARSGGPEKGRASDIA
jgi:hypothetical protein